MRQIFEVPYLPPFRVDAVQGVLERHLLVRPGPVEQRDARAERLEVEEADRIPGLLEELPARNFAPPAGFERVEEPKRERGGLPTMPGGRKPVLPVTVFTDYI